MSGPPVDPTLCITALFLPILAPCFYYLYIRLQMRHAKKARLVYPLHLKMAYSMAASSSLNVLIGVGCLLSPFYLGTACIPFYAIPAIIFAVVAIYHWYEYKWYLDESKRVS